MTPKFWMIVNGIVGLMNIQFYFLVGAPLNLIVGSFCLISAALSAFVMVRS